MQIVLADVYSRNEWAMSRPHAAGAPGITAWVSRAQAPDFVQQGMIAAAPSQHLLRACKNEVDEKLIDSLLCIRGDSGPQRQALSPRSKKTEHDDVVLRRYTRSQLKADVRRLQPGLLSSPQAPFSANEFAFRQSTIESPAAMQPSEARDGAILCFL